jgi:release factor glutamine methyltransferase
MTNAAVKDEPWTIRRVLGWTSQHFETKGIDSPRLTAEVLLAHALKLTRVRLYVDFDRPLEGAELKAYRALISRRVEGEPTQDLTGEKEFYTRRVAVDARVLVPRPETELLAEAVLRAVPQDGPSAVLDLCTGSGCLAVTIAAERPQATVAATDLSPQACEVARTNIAAHQVQDRVTVYEGDLASAVPSGMAFDVVVCNPPYVATAEIDGLSAEVRREPRMALDGGADGLQLFRRVIPTALPLLKPGGLLALEIGETQGSAIAALLREAGYGNVRIERDLERRERHAYGERPAA